MNLHRFLKELPRALLISFLIFVVLVTIPVLNGGTITFNTSLKINFLYTMLYGMSLYYANAILYMFSKIGLKKSQLEKTYVFV